MCRWSSSASRWIRPIAWRGCFRFLAHCVEFQVEKLRRRKQRPKMNLFQRRWCDLSEAAVDDDDEHNEMTIKRTRRKKEEDHQYRCVIQMRHLELLSIYCRHALHYHTSFWYFVWFSWPLHSFVCQCISHAFSWHAAGWCPCGCCQPKRSSTLSHRRVFLDADAEGTRKAAEAIWCWQSEMPGVWPGGKRFLRSFSFSKRLIFLDVGKLRN